MLRPGDLGSGGAVQRFSALPCGRAQSDLPSAASAGEFKCGPWDHNVHQCTLSLYIYVYIYICTRVKYICVYIYYIHRYPVCTYDNTCIPARVHPLVLSSDDEAGMKTIGVG